MMNVFRRGAQCVPISLPIRNVSYRTATHIGCSPQVQHSSAAQLVCMLLQKAPANKICRNRYLVGRGALTPPYG